MNLIPVLDHGYVKLLNISGPFHHGKPYNVDDTDPANTARMSFDQTGTKTRAEDLKLVDYLITHSHTTPVEMIQVWLEMKLPIFVARQFVRHRTCVTGDQTISFELPAGKSSGGVRHYPVTVERLFKNFNQGAELTDRWGNRRVISQEKRIKNMHIRCYDESLGEITYSQLKDIWEVGQRQVLEVLFDDGSSIRATPDHEFFTNVGWLPLEQAIDHAFAKAGNCEPIAKNHHPTPNIAIEQWFPIQNYEDRYMVSSEGRVATLINTRGVLLKEPKIKKQTVTNCGYAAVSLSRGGETKVFLVHHLVLNAFVGERLFGQETRHLDGNRLNNKAENLCWGSSQDNSDDRKKVGSKAKLAIRWKHPISVKSAGFQTVYDLSVTEHQNFFVNNTLAHNCSINEVSARYTKLPNEYYLPALSSITTKSPSNKQGRSSDPHPDALAFQTSLDLICKRAYLDYQYFLERGVAPELCRTLLPVNFYTKWIWRQDLHNLLHFISLRKDHHAQWEAQQYALAIEKLLSFHVPHIISLHQRKP